MKNYKSYISALAVLTLASCDPMHDVYEELDKDKLPVNNAIEYTLTEADYKAIKAEALKVSSTKNDTILANSIESRISFNERFTSTEFVPFILAKKFPQLGESSKAMVSSNTTENASKNVSIVLNGKTVLFKAADVENVTGEQFLHPSNPINKSISQLMQFKAVDAIKDSLVQISVPFSEQIPSVGNIYKPYLVEDFSKDLKWDVFVEKGVNVWSYQSKYGEIKASTFRIEEECVNAFISNEFVLDNEIDSKFSFDINLTNYNHETSPLKVLLTTSYTGDYATTEWIDITTGLLIPQVETNRYISTTRVDLAAYKGNSLRFAFVYTGDSKQTSNVFIDNLRIETVETGIQNDVKTLNLFVNYNGIEWTVADHALVLNIDDYYALGQSRPNFGDYSTALNLVSNYISHKFAGCGDNDIVLVKYVVYDQALKSNVTIVNEFKMLNGLFTYMQEQTEQFAFKDGKWAFSPSVEFTLSKDDYGLIVEWVKANKTAYMDPKYDNSEYYFGASAHYGNFNHIVANLTDADKRGDNEFKDKNIDEVMLARMKKCFAEVLLPAKYANEEIIPGIDKYFIPSYIIYDPANTTYSMKFKLVGKGQFEYVEGPIKK